MIVFFVGTPGSGKSYEAVKKVVDNIKLGRVVCTNIDGMDEQEHQEYLKNLLNIDDYEFNTHFRFLSKNQVLNFWGTESKTYTRMIDGEEVSFTRDEYICPKGSLIIIDEAHKHFNARDWQKQENRALADWASTHRHDGYDVVLITQDIEKVEKQVRTLTEWTYYFRKVNFLGGAVKKKYLCYSYSGDDHNGQALAKNIRSYNPLIFPCYKSYTTADAKEVGFMQHINILRHPVFFALPLVLLFCFYMFSKSSFATGDLFGTGKRMKDAQAKIELQRKQQNQTAQPKPQLPPPPPAPAMPAPPVSAVPAQAPQPQPPITPVTVTAPGTQPESSPAIAAATGPPRVVGSISADKKTFHLLLSDGRTVQTRRNIGIGTIYIR